MSKSMPWFRFYSEALHDRKITKAAQDAGLPRLVVFGAWAAILSLASESPHRGKLLVTLLERFTETDIADELCFSETDVTKLLAAFVKYEMLYQENGVYCVTNWEKRQFDSDISTDRVRKHREKQRSNVSETPQTQTQTQIQTNTITTTGGIFKAYESNIGPIVQKVSEDIKDLIEEYPPEWIIESFEIAAVQNKRNLAYSKAILKRWMAEGKDDGTLPKKNGSPRKQDARDEFRALLLEAK